MIGIDRIYGTRVFGMDFVTLANCYQTLEARSRVVWPICYKITANTHYIGTFILIQSTCES